MQNSDIGKGQYDIMSLDVNTGETQWSVPFKPSKFGGEIKTIASSPTGDLYVKTEKSLSIIDGKTGETKWMQKQGFFSKTKLSDIIEVGNRGEAYIWSTNTKDNSNTLQVIDPQTGDAKTILDDKGSYGNRSPVTFVSPDGKRLIVEVEAKNDNNLKPGDSDRFLVFDTDNYQILHEGDGLIHKRPVWDSDGNMYLTVIRDADRDDVIQFISADFSKTEELTLNEKSKEKEGRRDYPVDVCGGTLVMKQDHIELLKMEDCKTLYGLKMNPDCDSTHFKSKDADGGIKHNTVWSQPMGVNRVFFQAVGDGENFIARDRTSYFSTAVTGFSLQPSNPKRKLKIDSSESAGEQKTDSPKGIVIDNEKGELSIKGVKLRIRKKQEEG
jgi:DNA-binding beta-propeller fold protein YncE